MNFHYNLVKNAILWGADRQEIKSLLESNACVFKDEAIRIGMMLAAKEKENQGWDSNEAI